MNNRTTVRIMAGLICAWPLLLEAQPSPTHEHGHARLNLDQDEGTLMLELEVPANDLVGFEHLPTNAGERDKVAKVAESLTDYHNVISLLGDQGELKCEQTYGEIESALMEREPEPAVVEEVQDEHEDEEATHADFFVNYELQCPGTPRILKATLIDAYPGLVALHVKWALDEAGAGEKVLTSSELQVSF